MENKHILTVSEFKELARPTSKHIEENEVNTFIRECEDMHIIPAVGLDTFEELTAEEVADDRKILLNGGVWTDKDGKRQKCGGLKLALAYFVYGKMMMADGAIVTRTGLMQHNDDYASRTDDKNRVRRYNDVMNVAESYLDGCLSYWKSIKGDGVKPVRGSRVHIHAIGD